MKVEELGGSSLDVCAAEHLDHQLFDLKLQVTSCICALSVDEIEQNVLNFTQFEVLRLD